MASACDPSTRKGESGVAGVQSHPHLPSESEEPVLQRKNLISKRQRKGGRKTETAKGERKKEIEEEEREEKRILKQFWKRSYKGLKSSSADTHFMLTHSPTLI